MAFKIKIRVTESLEELKRLFHSHPVYLHSRIQMLYTNLHIKIPINTLCIYGIQN
jgi:hypothetical protein